MIIHKKDLLNIKDEKVYEFFYDYITIDNNLFIRGIKDCDGYFIFYYDESDKLVCEYKMTCKMVCPDAYTLEDVEVPLTLDDSEIVIDDVGQEGIYIETLIKEEDLIKQLILPLVPIKVAKNEKIEYSNVANWSVVKEEDLKTSDPRLEEFKKFKGE